MEKRNAAIDLTDLAIGVLILGITVAIGTRVLINYRDNRLTDLPLLRAVNETNTSSVNASASGPGSLNGTVLSNRWARSLTACYNATKEAGGTQTGEILGTANYTFAVDPVNGEGHVYLSSTVSEYNDSSINCTYDYYDITEAQWSLPDSAATGIGEYGNWFDIIVIVGIAALILSLIFLAFGRGKEAGGVAY